MSDIEAYKHTIYKLWPSFNAWKSWVEFQLLNREQRLADQSVIDGDRRNGAVLVTLIVPQSIWEGYTDSYLDHIYTILELRSKKLNKNPGDVAFPGGKIDKSDNGPVAAAIREANEEVGLENSDLEVIGLMDEFVSNSKMVVYPVVAWKIMPTPPEELYNVLKSKYYPRTMESEAVSIVPLTHLLDDHNYMSTEIQFQESMRRVFIRFFNIDKYLTGVHVWGLTASILRRFLDIVFPGNSLPEEIIG